MKILIFTNSTSVDTDADKWSKSLNLLKIAAEKRGHQIFAFNPKDCSLIFQEGKSKIKVSGVPSSKIVLSRVSFAGSKMEFNGVILKQMELDGKHVINSYGALRDTKNKIKQLQILHRKRIPIPKSYVVHSSAFTDEITSMIGKFPVIIKKPSGSKGSGISIVESKRALKSVIDMLTSDSDNDSSMSAGLIVQEYVRESKGKDIRVIVVGGKIIAAMHRIARKRDEFRSNFHLGGRVAVAELSAEEKRIARKSAKALGLEIAGVDLIRSKNGPKVLEVNANPGLTGITEATKIDVAGKIIKYLELVSKKKED